MENPIMTLTMTDGGKIVCELYPEKAPLTAPMPAEPATV